MDSAGVLETTKVRYEKAIKATRKRGVKVRQNVASCCRGCAEPFEKTKNFDEDSTPYVWTFGGQGSALTWENDTPYYRDGLNRARNRRYRYNTDDAKYDSLYFNHGNGGAEILAEELRREGFNVEWNGTDSQTVILHFKEFASV